MQRVRPVFIVVWADAYVIDGGDLLGGKTAHTHSVLRGRQWDEVGQAAIIAPLPSENIEERVVKPPAATLCQQ